MSASQYRENSPQHAAVRDAVTAFVRAMGIKRGIPAAAQALGMGERAARHAYEGTDFAADAERAAKADAARLALLDQQIAALRAEAETLRRRDVGMARPALDARGGNLRGHRVAMLQAGAR